ncbi:Hint domain-containing protein [Roseovarius sp.]|uniref:Hint domain-containing protein n=1 Tax=Roseovarius sp. TaxID=1486281 RepID=UPI003A96D251
MAETKLLLNGFSIIGNPQTNTNASAGGNLMIHDGDAIFEANDIVVFLVEGATENGVLTDDSVIVGVIVYDNASDYFNDIPLYTYEALPGGGADIDFGRDTMGDRYLELDASSLVSADEGAPVLGTLAAVAGVDILGTLATSTGPLVVPTNENIDLNGDGIISPEEAADASFSSALNILTENNIVCFAEGTLIETPMGPQPVETLREGDLVNTLDDGPQPVRWIGAQSIVGTGANAPIRIMRGALGNVRDLRVSQNHRMLITGPQAELLFGEHQVLVAAKHLVNDRTIRVEPCAGVVYWHFLLDQHHVVFAEAAPTESLFPGQHSLNAVGEVERDEILAYFPMLADDDYSFDTSRYTLRAFEAQALRLHA